MQPRKMPRWSNIEWIPLVNRDPTPFFYDDGWLNGSADIRLPCDGFKFSSEAEAPTFNVEFQYRKLT